MPITHGTLYHTVDAARAGRPRREVGVDRDGNRPERTTFAITDAGPRAVDANGCARSSRTSIGHALFPIALAEAHDLDRDDVDRPAQRARRAGSPTRAEHADGTRDRRRTRRAPAVPPRARAGGDAAPAELDWLDDPRSTRLDPARFRWETIDAATERYLAQTKGRTAMTEQTTQARHPLARPRPPCGTRGRPSGRSSSGSS